MRLPVWLASKTRRAKRASRNAQHAAAFDPPVSKLLRIPHILLTVFEHAIQDDHEMLYVLLRVCSKWRALVNDEPSLWRYFTITPTTPSEKIALSLERGRKAIVSLQVRGSLYFHSRGEDTYANRLKGVSWEKLESLHIQNTVDNGLPMAWYPLSLFFTLHFQSVTGFFRLREFEVDNAGKMDEPFSFWLADQLNTSRLTTFKIYNLEQLSSLRELGLRNCSCLEHLTLMNRYGEQDVEPYVCDDRPIYLPNLKELNLWRPSVGWLRGLEIPSVRIIRIRALQYEALELLGASNILFHNLEIVSLSMPSLRGEPIKSFLSKAPDLKHFTLCLESPSSTTTATRLHTETEQLVDYVVSDPSLCPHLRYIQLMKGMSSESPEELASVKRSDSAVGSQHLDDSVLSTFDMLVMDQDLRSSDGRIGEMSSDAVWRKARKEEKERRKLK